MATGDLAGAAVEALDGAEGAQEKLPGTDYVRTKFVGMSWDTLAELPLMDVVEFTVKGRVVGHGEDVMADGEIRRTMKIRVDSVSPVEKTA